jgi:hypothetical protein
MRRFWLSVFLLALLVLAAARKQSGVDLNERFDADLPDQAAEIAAAEVEPERELDENRVEELPIDDEVEVILEGILVLVVLPDGTVETPDRASGYRGAVPKTWVRGADGLRLDEDAVGSLFLHATWNDADGAVYSGSDWFELDGLTELRIPVEPAQVILTGVVRQAGVPVPGHAIHISDRLQRFAAQTDEQGRFRFDLPRAREVLVKVGYIHSPSFREEIDLRDGGEKHLEYDLPLGGLELEVVFPAGVEIPKNFAVALSPVGGRTILGRETRKLAPVREDSIARFEGIVPGEYHFYVGIPDFGRVDFASIGVSCYEGTVAIADSVQSLRIELPALTRVTLLVKEEGHPKQGLSCFASYRRLDNGAVSLPGRELSTAIHLSQLGEVMAPGHYLFHVGGNGYGWADVEFEVIEGQNNLIEVTLDQPSFTVSAAFEDSEYAQVAVVYYLDASGRCIGKFQANNGAKMRFSFTRNGGSELEESVYDSAVPKLGSVHVPEQGVYTFVARLREGQRIVSLGDFAIAEPGETIQLKLPQ